MKSNKTTANQNDVFEFLDTLNDEQQVKDSRTLIEIMQEVSGENPVMWGTSIIGFGSQHYKYASGREGDWMKIGFAPRKGQLSLYATCDVKLLEDELEDLGQYTTGKGCIYIKELADVDQGKLKNLIRVAYDNAGFYPEGGND